MSEERAFLAWQKLVDSKQTRLKYRNAFAGNGAGVVDVDGEPGFIWCRYSADQGKASKVFSMERGIPEDFPIKVGRRFPDDEFEQVLKIDWTQYQDIVTQDSVDNFNTSNHGESHNAADGADPAPIDLRNIIEMRGRAQTVADLTIFVERGQYTYGSSVNRYPGEIVDLTASVPGGIGHRYVLVYVDGATNLAAFDNSVVVPIAATPVIPDWTANTIPICIVDLAFGQTTIDEDDIFDWRFLFNLLSNIAPWLVGTNAERLVLVVGDLAELTRFYETDTDQIWEVWEGAWRIVYPPPGLTAPDGDPNLVWAVGNTGTLTGDAVLSQNIDDAATNTATTYHDIDHRTSGAAAAGFGSKISYRLEDAAGGIENAATINIEWEDPANGAEASQVRILLRKAGAALAEVVKFTSTVFNTSLVGRIVNTTRQAAVYTALVTDHMIYADTDGGAWTLTLPVGAEGQYFRIANVGTSGNDVTIDGNGAETVMGALTQTLSDGEIMILVYNATEGWW